MTYSRLFYPLVAVIMIMMASCGDYDIPDHKVPQIFMSAATDITRTSAMVHASVGTARNDRLTFEYGQEGGALLTTPLLTADGDSVHAQLDNLKPGTTYRCHLATDNGRTVVRSNEISFDTNSNDLPSISPLSSLAKGPSSIIVAYHITDNGGEDVLSTGCLVTNTTTGQTLTFSMPTPIDDGAEQRLVISGLQQMTTYHITPYAANSVGQTTGETMEYTTDNSVSLGNGGQLSDIMQGDKTHYTTLTLSGDMNGDDFKTLRTIDVDNINLAEVNIIEGGGAYIPSRYTQANTVGYGMFSDMNITGIILPHSAVTVEEQAFKNCTTLTSITMPVSATSILPSANCGALSSIEVPEANGSYRSIEGILYDIDVSEIVWMPVGKTGEVKLPNTITSIGDYAFRGCLFTSFVMSNSVEEMGQAAFYGSSVQKVVMSDALLTVPTATFQQCTDLTEVHLGTDTEQLGEYVFDGTRLTNLYVTAIYPPVCYSKTFTNNDGYDIFKQCTLYVMPGSKSMYRNHSYWGKFSYIKEITSNLSE